MSFTFEHLFGPCPAELVCERRMVIQDTGETDWNDQGMLYNDVLTAPELSRVTSIVTDPDVLRAMREPRTDCLAVTDNWENVQIVLGAMSPLQKDIAGCSGEPYWQIRGVVNDLIDAHF